MRLMAELLKQDRYADEVMERLAAEQEQALVASYAGTGRNQPCPCGSGRKYKHCHGKEA